MGGQSARELSASTSPPTWWEPRNPGQGCIIVLVLVVLALVLAVFRRCVMPNGKGRLRRFGSIRKLPSGRYQARYPGPDGVLRSADDTFSTKGEAEDWLTLRAAEILEGNWIDPDAGAVLVADYGTTWIDERPNLRPKTIRLYTYLLRSRIAPHFANVTVAEVTLARVRRWRKKLLDSGVSEVTTAKAYRLLRAIFNTALDDGAIKRNPLPGQRR